MVLKNRIVKVILYLPTHLFTPSLGTQDIKPAIKFYTEKLGFDLVFADQSESPNYVGFCRDGVELRMQFQYAYEMRTTRIRFAIVDPDALFEAYQHRKVKFGDLGIRDTPWGTREFALYDLDDNQLTFFCSTNQK